MNQYHLLYHLVWSTEEQSPSIIPEIQNGLYAYMEKIFKYQNCYPVLIGGTSDQIHAYVKIPPTLAICDVIRNIKNSTSKFLRNRSSIGEDFSWQQGYMAFTISPSVETAAINHIKTQEELSQQEDLKNELILFLDKHKVIYEEKVG